jgi:hypothetical protein
MYVNPLIRLHINHPHQQATNICNYDSYLFMETIRKNELHHSQTCILIIYINMLHYALTFIYNSLSLHASKYNYLFLFQITLSFLFIYVCEWFEDLLLHCSTIHNLSYFNLYPCFFMKVDVILFLFTLESVRIS